MLLTKNTTFIIGPVAEVLGYLMDAIFSACSSLFGIQNIGFTIILATVIVYLLMLPLTVKQQKFSKLSAKMNPELQAINKKYEGKKDQNSMIKRQEETKAIYAKYGVSATGSCLQLLIQMPLLFALYRVVWNVPAYVTEVKNAFFPLVNDLLNVSEGKKFIETMATEHNIKFTDLNQNIVVDTLYKFKPENWETLTQKFPALADVIADANQQINHMNDFFGLNISESPFSVLTQGFSEKSILLMIAGLSVPILAGLTQWLNTKLMPQPTSAPGAEEGGGIAGSMKSMNTIMPIMSVVFCFTLPAGMGIYWIAGAVVRSVIQVITNKRLESIDLDELIKKNIEKANKKREKKGLPPQKISNTAKINVKNIGVSKDKTTEEVNKKDIKDSTDYYKNQKDAKPGSLAAKARMVQKYNEKK